LNNIDINRNQLNSINDKNNEPLNTNKNDNIVNKPKPIETSFFGIQLKNPEQ